MRAALSLLLLLPLVACGGNAEPESDNVFAANSPADIETLPPDESSATPDEELANGSAEPTVNDLGNQH